MKTARARIFLATAMPFPSRMGKCWQQACAAFYWDTLLPCVVERTRAADFPTPDGYVLSTLGPHSYGGTYPDVDHEFQVKGRLAMGSPLDEDVARRMMELQLQMMREDPEGCGATPARCRATGSREYHVRRSSLDGTRQRAHVPDHRQRRDPGRSLAVYRRVKDHAWLEDHIADLEGAASGIEDYIDPAMGGCGRMCITKTRSSRTGGCATRRLSPPTAFSLLAELEEFLGRDGPGGLLSQPRRTTGPRPDRPCPARILGPASQRFTNWVDRSGKAHDHVHLLSNELPALFGFAQPSRRSPCWRLVDEHLEEFQRFPSFVALRPGRLYRHRNWRRRAI